MDVQGQIAANRSEDGTSESLSSVIRSIAGALRRRWRTLAVITMAVFALVVILVMLITPHFVAVTRVKIDPSQSAITGQVSDRTGLPDQSIVDTEVSVMRSLDLAREVAARMDLVNDPEFTKGLSLEPAKPGSAAAATLLTAVAGKVQSGLNVQREKATYIVNIAFESTNASKAARIANAFAQQYIESSVGRRTGTAGRQAELLDKRVDALSRDALAKDAQLAQYRASAGIVGDGKGSVTDLQITPLAGQLATAESEAAAARAKLAIARTQVAAGGLTNVSAVLESDVIANFRAQRAEVGRAQSEAATRYGPKHPETMKVTQQLQSIDQQIDAEARRVIGGLQSEATAATARAASLRSDMARLQGRQSSDTRASGIAVSLERQADRAQEALTQASQAAQQVNQIRQNSLSQAQIIEAAAPPGRPASPNRPLLLAAGLVFAVVLGTGTITFQELMSVGLRTTRDVESLGVSFITSIPKLTERQLKGRAAGGSPADTLIDTPMTSYAEAFRVIRSTLKLGVDQEPQIIAIASSLPDEGKTTSALSLARVMALSGEKTLLIDTDVRRAGLATLVGRSTTVGLVEILRDAVAPDEAISPDVIPGLDVMLVAAASFVAEDLFSGEAMRNLLVSLRSSYARIVIDTAPLLGVADARNVAAIVDAVILVAKWDETPRAAIASAISWLELDQAPVAGVVLTMVEPNAEAFGALYYSRKYAEYYRAE
jgi:capsular exopolysaccharide synthesis family protein